MKKLMYWSRNTLLQLCLLLVFGLMSCQQDEIIPLKEDDLVENPIGDIPELDMENPAGVVVDEKGNIVGYYDSQNNRYDQDGNLSNQKTTAYNSNDRLLAVLYDQESYKGISMMYFLQSSQTSLNIRDLRITGNFDNRARSMVVGPDVNIQLFEHSGYRGERISQGQFNSSPHYIPSLSSYISGKASSLRIRTTSGSNANGSTFCGMLFDNGRWSRGNAHIPIFKGNELKLADYGLDNRVSSYAANDNSNCSGVMLYDHVSDLGQNYHWASRGEDIDYFSSHSSGMDNKISRVVETTQIDHDYRRLARNKKVGLITFSRSNFEGNPTIYYQGTDISTSFFGWKIYSYVVAPHTKFRHRSQSGSIQVVSPGGYQNSYLSTDIIKVESQNLSNSAYNDNNYCGELYNDSGGAGGGAGGWIRSDRKHIPIFEGLTNYSLADGKKIIKLSNVTGDLNNRGSTFQATDMTTSCSGVTFWKDDSFANTIIGKRAWFPVDGQKHSLPSGIDNTVSSISVEGCNGESTLMGTESYNAGAEMHRFLGDAYNTRTNGNVPFWKEFTREAVRPAVGGFVSLGASAVLGYFGTQNMMTIVGTGVATTVLCAVGMGKAINLSRNSAYTSRGLFPATGGYFSFAWQRANLKIAGLRGFYFLGETQLNEFKANPDLAMKKAKWFVNLPTYSVTFDGLTANVNEFINEHGWVKFQELLEAASKVGTGNPLNGLKNWMDRNMVEQLKYLKSDFYLSTLETLAAVPAGVYGGYMIGTGIDAGSASVKIDAADIKNRYLRGQFYNATGTNGRIK
jgi:hypothetical protein